MATSQPPPSTGIKVIIVGAGFAGLTAAIECHRKGHEVLVLESFPELKILGDIISFAPNSGRIFQRWEGVDAKLDPIIHKSDGLRIKTWKGEDLTKQTWGEEGKKLGKAYNGHVRCLKFRVLRHSVCFMNLVLFPFSNVLEFHVLLEICRQWKCCADFPSEEKYTR